jgi:hypothetical protein
MTVRTLLLVVMALLTCATTLAFQASLPRAPAAAACATPRETTILHLFGKKKEDLSFIESRDMTKQEMFELNKQNEDIMTAELWGMTLFSLVISVPMLYLVWVGFFAETAGDVEDLL